MKVSELVDKLRQYDDEVPVTMVVNGYGYEIHDLELDNDDGDLMIVADD